MNKKFVIFSLFLLYVIATAGPCIASWNAYSAKNELEATITELSPILTFHPKSHDFGNIARGDIATTTFEIWNSGCNTCGDPLDYSFSVNKSWLDVFPTSGAAGSEHDTITVTVNTTELIAGNYYDFILIDSDGGSGKFSVSLSVIDEYANITVQEAWDLLNDPSNGIQIPIDVRTDNAWIAEHIDTPFPENPQHHDFTKWGDPSILAEFMSLYRGKEIILYCTGGFTSFSAIKMLIANGFEGIIYNMIGGITGWKNHGYPTISYTILDLTNISGKFGAATIDITNSGNRIAENVTLVVKITGGILSNIDHTYDSSIHGISELELLNPGSITTVSTIKSGLILGFGPVQLCATLTADNADKVIRTVDGNIFGLLLVMVN